jgi:hypothetical protein
MPSGEPSGKPSGTTALRSKWYLDIYLGVPCWQVARATGTQMFDQTPATFRRAARPSTEERSWSFAITKRIGVPDVQRHSVRFQIPFEIAENGSGIQNSPELRSKFATKASSISNIAMYLLFVPVIY